MFGNTELCYCGDLTRRHDPDRFLVSLALPPDRRPDLWALLAFNHEIAKTREVVSDTTLGLIRLQWWRDALAAFYERDEMPAHEILEALARAIRAHDLLRADFDALIYGREFDLENVAPSSLEGMVKYAEYTAVPLSRLAVQVGGGDPAHAAVSPAATAYALSGLLRAYGFHARQGRSYLPADLVEQQGLQPAVRAVAAQAQLLLDQMPRPADKFSRASAKVAALYLGQIRGLNYDLCDSRLALKPLFFHWRYLLSG